jgi:hypothetical protein
MGSLADHKSTLPLGSTEPEEGTKLKLVSADQRAVAAVCAVKGERAAVGARRSSGSTLAAGSAT